MLIRFVSKFCVEPWSPFSNISHHDPKTLGKPLIIVSWPECQPEFPSDGDGGGGDGGFPRTLSIWSCPGSITPRNQISRAGNPSLRCAYMCLDRLWTATSLRFRAESVAKIRLDMPHVIPAQQRLLAQLRAA